MKRLFALAVLCTTAATASAHQPMLAPALGPIEHRAGYAPELLPTPSVPPAPGLQPGTIAAVPSQAVLTPIPADIQPGVVICNACDGGHIRLYDRVRVVNARNIAPCAESKIVSVPDPCNPCKVVFLEICVPKGKCENIDCYPHKNRTIFDYGRYSVKVTERRGTLFVNYEETKK